MIVGFGVDLDGFGVGGAFDFLDLFVGFGFDLEEVALFVAEDFGGFALAFGAEALGDLFALADHALVDGV